MRQFVKFIVAGVLNTGLTYLLFLILLRTFGYRISYSLTYAAGIVIAYVLQTYFVFEVKNSVRMGLAVVASYALQYAYGLAALSVLIGGFAFRASIAMIIVMVTAVPVQFLALRLVAQTVVQDARSDG